MTLVPVALLIVSRLQMMCSLAINARFPNNFVYSLACCARSYGTAPRTKQEVKPPGKVRFYVVTRYVRYLEKIENTFEKAYPKAYKVYRLFKDGIKDFFTDTKMYYKVATELWSGESLSRFSYKELDNYRKMPSDMICVAPVLLLSTLPFANYVVFPVAYLFPRQLLCRHFWTPQQRVDYSAYYLCRRLRHYASILSYMQNHATTIDDRVQRRELEDLLWRIQQKEQPSVEEIIVHRPLFITRPFGLNYLAKVHKIHMWHLAKSLGLSTRRYRLLLQDVRVLHHMDAAMLNEGIDKLDIEDLQQSCFTRGLNAVGLDRDQLTHYLKQWTQLSQNVDDTSLSLLLHAPVLLAYNQPTNAKHMPPYDTPDT